MITIPAPTNQIVGFLTYLDWLIFLASLIFTWGFAHFATYLPKSKHISFNCELLLMGRQLTLPLFVATLVATWYGGIFGVTQIAYEQGIYNFFTQGLFWYISYLIFACFLVKKIRSHTAYTLLDLIKQRYGPYSAQVCAVFVFIKTLPIAYVVSLGLFLQCLFPLSFFSAACIGIIFVIIYTYTGGFRAIVYSDLIQFFIMFFSTLLVVGYSWANYGGLKFLQMHLPDSYFQPTGSRPISAFFIWIFIACSTTFVNPAFYQRCLAAKSHATAKLGIFISVIIWICFDLATTFGAMYAKAVMPEQPSLFAYIIYGMHLLPTGLRGLLLAGILATILSTLDSFLFIASNILFYDLQIFQNFKKNHHRYIISLIVSGALTLAGVYYFQGSMEQLWLTLKSYFSACIIFPIIWGYFMSSSLTDKQFIKCISCGILSMLTWDSLSSLYLKTLFPTFYIGLSSTALTTLYYTLHQSHFLSRLRSYFANAIIIYFNTDEAKRQKL